jgi:hypothetical protein
MSVILNIDGGIDFPNGINFAADKLFSAADSSQASSGYQKLPSGWIIQWGVSIDGATTVTFPIAFPTACRNFQMKWFDFPVSLTFSQYLGCTARSTTNATIIATTSPRFWMAMGN